jgi:hypothetical protein
MVGAQTNSDSLDKNSYHIKKMNKIRAVFSNVHPQNPYTVMVLQNCTSSADCPTLCHPIPLCADIADIP